MGLGSLLAERGDPAAVDRARRALDICAERGSPDQLQATLATAAMIAWQVRRHHDLSGVGCRRVCAARRSPAHRAGRAGDGRGGVRAGGRRARAGGGADPGGAPRRGRTRRGSRASRSRRPSRARICVARGDLDGARDLALAQLTAVQRLGFAYPGATALETAAVVARELGVDADRVMPLLATAAAIRARGSRAAPAPIRVASPDGALPLLDPPLDTPDAIETARRLLTA